jgi:hypothetical protein
MLLLKLYILDINITELSYNALISAYSKLDSCYN